MTNLRDFWLQKKMRTMQLYALEHYGKKAMESALRVGRTTGHIVTHSASTPLPDDVVADLERAKLTQYRIDNGLTNFRYLKLADSDG